MRGRTETEQLVVAAVVAAGIGAVGLAVIVGVWPGALLSGVPVVVALVPVVVRRRGARIVSAALLWATCVLAGTSFVGILLVPAAILMTIAAARHDEPVPAAVSAMRAPTKVDRSTVAAFVVAIAGAIVAAFAPLGRSCSSTAVVPALGHGSPAPSVEEVCRGVNTFSVDGSWVLVVVSVPVLVALVPVLVRRRTARIVSAVLLWACCVVGMWSVGMFFVPAAIVMTIAAARPDPVPVMPA